MLPSRRLLAALPLLTAGCAIATPFRRAADTTATDEAVVAVTNATLKPDLALRKLFWRHTATVEASLPAQPGFLGHSKRAAVAGNEVWTMTAWTDARALEAFVESPAHIDAILLGMPAVARARFARLTVPRTALPPRWRDALAALAARGRTYA
jgi:heme-degrading monooxygenase HmoA